MFLFALNNWRWLLMAALVAYGAFWQWRASVWEGRYETEKVAFQTFRAEVAALGNAAKKAAEEKKASQDKVTKEVRDASKSDRAAISDYYRLRLPANSGGGVLPTPADSTGKPDAAPGEQVSSGSCISPESAALDAEQVMRWQEFARRNGFPVE